MKDSGDQFSWVVYESFIALAYDNSWGNSVHAHYAIMCQVQGGKTKKVEGGEISCALETGLEMNEENAGGGLEVGLEVGWRSDWRWAGGTPGTLQTIPLLRPQECSAKPKHTTLLIQTKIHKTAMARKRSSATTLTHWCTRYVAPANTHTHTHTPGSTQIWETTAGITEGHVVWASVLTKPSDPARHLWHI